MNFIIHIKSLRALVQINSKKLFQVASMGHISSIQITTSALLCMYEMPYSVFRIT